MEPDDEVVILHQEQARLWAQFAAAALGSSTNDADAEVTYAVRVADLLLKEYVKRWNE